AAGTTGGTGTRMATSGGAGRRHSRLNSQAASEPASTTVMAPPARAGARRAPAGGGAGDGGPAPAGRVRETARDDRISEAARDASHRLRSSDRSRQVG